MASDDLLSGDELLVSIERFLKGNEPLLDKIKTISRSGDKVRVLAMRCDAIEALADFLADSMAAGTLESQHDVVLVVGNVVLLNGDRSRLKQKDKDGREIDLVTWKRAIEVKSKRNVAVSDVPDFIKKYYKEIVHDKQSKQAWWLCFFMKRPPAKSHIRPVCKYYLVIVEISARDLTLDKTCRLEISDETMHLVEEVEKQAVEEDDVEEGFLAPVKNIWIVDRLRAQKQKLVEDNARIENSIKEQAKVIAEKDETIADQAKTIAELKKRLGME